MANQTASQNGTNSSADNEELSRWPADGLPSADLLKRYEEIVPGAAEKIIWMYERETEQRLALEREMRETGLRFARFGAVLSAIISIASLAAAFSLLFHGADVAAAIIGLAVPAMGLLQFLLTNKHLERGISKGKGQPTDSTERSTGSH